MSNKYKLNQSPFFKLKSKKKLSELLWISNKTLLDLIDDDNYYEKTLITGRKIKEPCKKLKKVHRRIKELLCKIETPKYLFSGIKKTSIVHNAKYHKNSNYMLTIDIKKFYDNCKEEYIFRFFHYTLKMSLDTSRIMAKLLTHKGIIPTATLR